MVQRRAPRSKFRLRVEVSGLDSGQNSFVQTAYAHDVSRWGARLEGIYCLRGSGVTIDVKHKGRTAKFLVIWMGQPGTREDGHVGLRNLQPEKNIWRLDLAQSTDEESYSQRP